LGRRDDAEMRSVGFAPDSRHSRTNSAPSLFGDVDCRDEGRDLSQGEDRLDRYSAYDVRRHGWWTRHICDIAVCIWREFRDRAGARQLARHVRQNARSPSKMSSYGTLCLRRRLGVGLDRDILW